MGLRRADFEAILGFLADVKDIDVEEPYSVEVLARLSDLIPCDAALYQRVDLGSRRYVGVLAYAPGDDSEDDEALYWSVGPCPITEYRSRTGDLKALTMADVISRQRYHELPIYREYFRPSGVDQLMDMGLSSDPSDHRSLVLFRGPDEVDFSERDKAVLELLRPHFRAREARAALRQRLLDITGPGADAGSSPDPALTAREREIIRLVAEGMTNAQIAAALWVAPGTVKKHLENVYAKLGVGRRAAVASRLHAEL
jgi:DNA-binding CsgD family transcriptional regulator